MTVSRNAWCDRALEALARLPGGGDSVTIRDQWNGFAARDKPCLTVFGSYDSGKSTLIKRLLVDGGVAVPTWLTISARRETFEANEVDAGTFVLRDTPGLSTSEGEHDTRAADTLALSDGFVVLLPPQLVTGDHALLLQLLTGRHFRAGGLAFPPGAVHLVIRRIDEAGVDPEDSLEEFRMLVARKEAELRALLSQAGVPDGLPVRAVAADAYQAVAGRPEASSAAYDPSRAWDGIRELSGALSHTAEMLPSLREAAHARFLMVRCVQARQVVAEEIGRHTVALEEAESIVERAELAATLIGQLVRGSRATLRGQLEDEIRGVMLSAHLDAAQLSARLESRLERVLASWTAEQNAKLRDVLADLDGEFRMRDSRPRAASLRGFFSERVAQERDEPRRLPGARYAHRVSEGMQSFLRAAHEMHVKMPLDKARAELKKISAAREAAETLAKESPLAGEAVRTVSSRYVHFHDALKTVGPAIIELGGLLYEAYQARQEASARAERRDELWKQVSAAIDAAATNHLDGDSKSGARGWVADVREILDKVRAAVEPQRALAGSLRQALDDLRQRDRELEELVGFGSPTMAISPTMAGPTDKSGPAGGR